MEIFFNFENKLDIRGLTATTTVEELCLAVEKFCQNQNITCANCMNNCCYYELIKADNVFMKQDSYAAEEKLKRQGYWKICDALFYDTQSHYWCLKKDMFGGCIHFQQGRCSIYSIRPLVCRLYLCHTNTYRFALIKHKIYETYHAALTFDIEQDLFGKQAKMPYHWKTPNPVVNATDYNVPIVSIIKWFNTNLI